MRRTLKIIIILIYFVFPVNTYGQARRIYLAPDDHTDIWWRADLDTYNQALLNMLDYYINLTDNTLNEPSNYQSRWNCDGSYWMWIYEKSRSAAQFQKLISYIKSGHLSVPLNPLPVVWGGTPAEAVVRAMYYPGKIERKYNLRLPLAYAMENQTLPLGLATLWKEAGAKYSWKGICQCATSLDATSRDHNIYWMQGLDNSKILMKWYSISSELGNTGPGGYAEARDAAASIDYVENNTSFKANYPFQVIGLFGKGWDDLETMTDEFITISKQETNSNRSVIVSNEVDFFEDFEKTYGSSLPVQAVSFGNDWDLGSAAIQEISSRLKRATEKLKGAEALSVFAEIADPAFMTGRDSERENAWMNMGLFFDHNLSFPGHYVTDGPTRRTSWQRELVDEIESYVNKLQLDAITTIGKCIKKPANSNRYFVFNPLSWTRTDFADLDISISAPFKVIDVSDNQEVPSQIIQSGGKNYLRILARNIPPVGYKVYEVINSAGQNYSNAATVTGNFLENSFYKLTATPKGSISSILSKKHSNREFVQQINNKTINDLGGSLTGSLSTENAGPVSVTLLINSQSELDHTTRITLYRDIDRIDISNVINQNFTGTETWAYGFNIPQYVLRHEEVGSVLKAKTVSNGGHYADKNANYEWLTMNHFADLSNNSYGVTISNADCYFMKEGNSTITNLDQNTPQVSILAGGRIYDHGLPNQANDTQFTQRFALRTNNGYDPASAMRFSLEHQNPFVTGAITGGTIFPDTAMSLVSIDNPDVLLWALKPAEDGFASGIIARVWNLSENSNSFKIRSYFPITSAQNVTLIETPVSDATIQDGAISGQAYSLGFKTFSMKLNLSMEKILNIYPEDKNVGSGSGTSSFTVTSNMNWSVTDDASWLTSTKVNSTTIGISFENNPSTIQRTATITVTGSEGLNKSVQVIQSGEDIIFDVSPDSVTLDSPPGSAYFVVSSNIDWNISEDADWLNVIKVNSDSIEVLVDRNNYKEDRSTTIAVTGEGGPSKEVVVTQKGDTTTGIPPEIKDFTALIFPNPFTNNIVIQLDTTIIDDVILSIIDITGRSVFENKIAHGSESGSISLDLSTLRPGFFFLRIGIKNIWKTFSIVKV